LALRVDVARRQPRLLLVLAFKLRLAPVDGLTARGEVADVLDDALIDIGNVGARLDLANGVRQGTTVRRRPLSLATLHAWQTLESQGRRCTATAEATASIAVNLCRGAQETIVGVRDLTATIPDGRTDVVAPNVVTVRLTVFGEAPTDHAVVVVIARCRQDSNRGVVSDERATVVTRHEGHSATPARLLGVRDLSTINALSLLVLPHNQVA